jgi:hypothetical protein
MRYPWMLGKKEREKRGDMGIAGVVLHPED